MRRKFNLSRCSGCAYEPVTGEVLKVQTPSGLSTENRETPLQRSSPPWSHKVRVHAVKRKQAAASDQIEPFGKDNNLPRHGRVALPGEHLLCKQNNSHAKSLPRLR